MPRASPGELGPTVPRVLLLVDRADLPSSFDLVYREAGAELASVRVELAEQTSQRLASTGLDQRWIAAAGLTGLAGLALLGSGRRA